MRTISFFILLLSTHICAHAAGTRKKGGRWLQGMYIQWGYNNEWYTSSNIHFRLSNGDDFTLHAARAHQKPDLHSIFSSPLDITVPQYNYRIGFYLNKNKTSAIEINFDHAKYVVTDGQTVHVTGTINGEAVDGDRVLDPRSFLHFEHTDGANWFHFNYVHQYTMLQAAKTDRTILTWLWKAGAGFNVPRTDFTYHGDRLNNKFHIAGLNAGVESGIRYYPFRNFFVEGTGKTGYVRYINALADTRYMKGNRASHDFEYVEVIATVGLDIPF